MSLSFKKIYKNLNEEKKKLSGVSISMDVINKLQNEYHIYNILSKGVNVLNETKGMDLDIFTGNEQDPTKGTKFNIPYKTIIFDREDSNDLSFKNNKQHQPSPVSKYYRIESNVWKPLEKKPLEGIITEHIKKASPDLIRIKHESEVKDENKEYIKTATMIGSPFKTLTGTDDITIYKTKVGYFYKTKSGSTDNYIYISLKDNLNANIKKEDIILLTRESNDMLTQNLRSDFTMLLLLVKGNIVVPTGIPVQQIVAKQEEVQPQNQPQTQQVQNNQQQTEKSPAEHPFEPGNPAPTSPELMNASIKRSIYNLLKEADENVNQSPIYQIIGPILINDLHASHLRDFIQRDVPVNKKLKQTADIAKSVASGIKDAIPGKDVQGVDLGTTGRLLDKSIEGIKNIGQKSGA